MQMGIQTKLQGLIGLMALTGLGLIVFTFITLAAQENDALVINVAGRQRMLSQKMAKEVLALASGFEEKAYRTALQGTFDLFGQSHQGLLNGDPKLNLPPTKDKNILGQMKKVDALWREFSDQVGLVLKEPLDSPKFKTAVAAVMNMNVPLLQEMNKAVELYEESSRNKVVFLKTVMAGSGLLTLLLAVFCWLFIAARITRPVSLIVAELSQGADHVAEVSNQVSTASQQLAEGSSEQAAAVAETSASLAEIAGQTRKNADDAERGSRLMGETKTTVAKAEASMKEMHQAMNEVAASGREIGKIIRTIDEIAFQTNLLALNAAVEAARAGEAGQGFAVVADEVRNLAQRAAEAAKTTAELIERTIGQIGQGTDLVGQVVEIFGQAAEKANRGAELVAGIARASGEQAQGIEQIEAAIKQMDQVTQRNAAGAEESAAAAEELSVQAETTRAVVDRMRSLIGGADDREAGTAARSAQTGGPGRRFNLSPSSEIKKLNYQKSRF